MKPQNATQKRRPLCDINVTPMVDVMLVLLIIFMVSAPLMKANIKVDLPKGGKADATMKRTCVILTMNARRQLFLNEQRLTPQQLETNLAQAFKNQAEKRLYISADKNLPYGDIISLIDQVHGLGYHLSLVSDPTKKPRKKA